jgi:hypothetical protein
LFKARDQTKSGRFPASGGSQQRVKETGLKPERYIVDRFGRPEMLRNAAQLDRSG